ncbi:P43 5S RNA-binding protein-like [Pelobates fuscus]|uniref:P43 5S RNA-binding protein-like n=1 Tax=Pelobates fuscus TaxID=191477 RepID=UPI002FE4BD88
MLGQRPVKPVDPSVHSCSSPGCTATFKKEWRLVEHMYKHAGQKPWKCSKPQCGAAFSKKRYLQRHQQHHIGEKIHKCTSIECRAAFWTKQHLKRHLLYRHGKDAPLKCSVKGCSKIFRKKHSLRLHLLEHAGKPLLVCDLNGCGKKLQSASQVAGHQRRHSGYKCPYQGCLTVCSTWSSLQNHRQKHPLNLKCPTCSKTFKKRSTLRKHKSVHAKVPVRLSCPREDCKETFGTVFNLMHHVRKIHLCLKTHSCYHAGCNRTFPMRESLLRHLVCHDPDRKKLKLKFQMPKRRTLRGASRALPSVEQDLSRLFNQKLLFRFKTLMESNLSSLFNERPLRDLADPETNLSGLFQLPPNRLRTERTT